MGISTGLLGPSPQEQPAWRWCPCAPPEPRGAQHRPSMCTGHLRAGGPGERAGRWAGPLGPRGPDLRPELSSAQQCVSQTKGKSAPQPGDRGPTGPRGQSRTGARRLAAGRSMGSSDPAHPPRSAPREPGATPGRPGAPPLVVPFPCRSHTQTERWGDPPGTRFFTSQT